MRLALLHLLKSCHLRLRPYPSKCRSWRPIKNLYAALRWALGPNSQLWFRSNAEALRNIFPLLPASSLLLRARPEIFHLSSKDRNATASKRMIESESHAGDQVHNHFHMKCGTHLQMDTSLQAQLTNFLVSFCLWLSRLCLARDWLVIGLRAPFLYQLDCSTLRWKPPPKNCRLASLALFYVPAGPYSLFSVSRLPLWLQSSVA